MKFLIVGVTSFIGTFVLEKILPVFSGQEDKVTCLARNSTDKEKLATLEGLALSHNRKIFFTIGNLFSSDSIYNCIKDADCLIYLVDLRNTAFIKNLLSAVSRTGIKRAVFVSSTSVLVPFEYEMKKAKLESEKLIEDFGRREGFDYTILRPTMIYGCTDDRNYSKMLNFIKKRGFFVMFGNGQNLIQPVFIEDVAGAVAAVINNKRTFNKIYALCGKEPIKYMDMLLVVKSLVKKPFKIIRLPLLASKFLVTVYSKIFPKSNLKPDMIERMQVDKAYSYKAAQKDFSFSPVPFRQGIEVLIRKMGL
jgi:nucleoside-diphosphate-sugar epimerase